MRETDVVIVGAGPSGLAMALALSQLQIRSIVLEKGHAICEDPRAIALTGDSMRMLHLLGISEKEMHQIGQPLSALKFYSGTFTSSPYLTIDLVLDWSSQSVLNALVFLQPGLEKMLRDRIHASQYTELKLDCTVTGIRHDANGVEALCKEKGAEEESVIRCKYLIGADGKRGFVRKGYLEEKGIQQKTGLFPYEATWIAANLHVTMPTPQSHPEFPLWELGYEPEELWDMFWPAGFHFCSDPAMPVATGRFGPVGKRFWRFEYELPRDFQTPDDLHAHLGEQMEKHLTLSPAGLRRGSRQPASSVRFPWDCVEILRCAPATFVQKVVNRWHDGRVILIGDAAHVFPPFSAQGISNGLRDAMALSWRLALLCRPETAGTAQLQSDYLLDTWAQERRRGVDDGTRLTAANGFFLQNKSKVLSAAVRFASGILDRVPFARSTILQNHLSDAPGLIGVEGGFFLEAEGGGGKAAQVFTKSANDSIQLSDGFFWNGAALTLLLLHQPTREEYAEILRIIERAKLSSFLLADRVVVLDSDSSGVDFPKTTSGLDRAILTPATADELRAAGVEPRPLYDPAAVRKRFQDQTKYVLMRADFIVFSQAHSLEKMEAQLARLGEMAAGVRNV